MTVTNKGTNRCPKVISGINGNIIILYQSTFLLSAELINKCKFASAVRLKADNLFALTKG